MNSLFSYNNLVHAVSGGCGSAVAMSTFYPLDTVRTRLQLQLKNTPVNLGDQKKTEGILAMLQEIFEKEGLNGVYRGLVPVIQSLYCSNFVYFYAFHGLKKTLNPEKSPLNDLLCGMTAGIINVMSTTPLWVVNTRIKMQHAAPVKGRHYTSILDGLCKVYKEEGIPGLWSGCTSSLILVINPAIQFMTYESLKRHLMARNGSQPPNALLLFLAGATAKAIATTLTYPIQLAQAKQRHSGGGQGMWRLIYTILQKDGFFGLFHGLNAKLLQTVLTAALMFLCYEKISSLVFAIMLGRRAKIAAKQ